jgi:hypothetical protein
VITFQTVSVTPIVSPQAGALFEEGKKESFQKRECWWDYIGIVGFDPDHVHRRKLHAHEISPISSRF